MKPMPERSDYRGRGDSFAKRRAPRFPITDCNYQLFSLRRFGGESAGSSAKSFLNISREYFRHEARWNFVAEILLFLAIIATAAVPLINGARAIIHFLHLPVA
jgi:hypothetical protein